MSINRHIFRVGTTLTVTGLLALAGAGIASAHVTAHSPDQVVAGGDAEIVFRSPNESENASAMTTLRVNFPQNTPLSNANVEPVTGWTYQINMAELAKPVKMANDTVTDAVASIVWTAQPGSALPPDGFQDFAISTEGLPTNTTDLVFTATQTYADGEVVNWNQPTPASGEEPDFPAPHLSVAPASGAADGSTAEGSTGVTATAQPTSTSGTDATARWIGGIGLVLAALALGFGLGALLRGRRSGPTNHPTPDSQPPQPDTAESPAPQAEQPAQQPAANSDEAAQPTEQASA
jgi:uncharacterized protein YcnI